MILISFFLFVKGLYETSYKSKCLTVGLFMFMFVYLSVCLFVCVCVCVCVRTFSQFQLEVTFTSSVNMTPLVNVFYFLKLNLILKFSRCLS